MASGKNREKTKQCYKKPKLRTIELAAEEVLVVGCKLSGSGSAVLNESSCTQPTQCFELGS